MTMHKPSTFPSHGNAAERGAPPFGTVPRQIGQQCEIETLLCHNQTVHSEWGKRAFVSTNTEKLHSSAARKVFWDDWCATAPTLTEAGCKSVKLSLRLTASWASLLDRPDSPSTIKNVSLCLLWQELKWLQLVCTTQKFKWCVGVKYTFF